MKLVKFQLTQPFSHYAGYTQFVMSLELARHLVMREVGILEADDAAYRVRHISSESHFLLTWTQ